MRKPFKGDFILTQRFGENPANYAQFGMKGHNGIDYALPTGTEVLAPHNGKIIEAASDTTGYGNYIKIENEREGSVLAHFKDFTVNVGDTVLEGQVVGHSDNTGNSTGPHLHWGYYLLPRDRTNGYAGYIDQINLISVASNMYKGYELTNLESMKVAVDILVRVQGGEFVDKSKYDIDTTKLNNTITNLNKTIGEAEKKNREQEIDISTLKSEALAKDKEIEKLTKQANLVPKLEETIEKNKILIKGYDDKIEIYQNAEISWNRAKAQYESTIADLKANAFKALCIYIYESIKNKLKNKEVKP